MVTIIFLVILIVSKVHLKESKRRYLEEKKPWEKGEREKKAVVYHNNHNVEWTRIVSIQNSIEGSEVHISILP